MIKIWTEETSKIKNSDFFSIMEMNTLNKIGIKNNG